MDRRRFLATAAFVPAATLLGRKLARADDHLKWAVFTPDGEVTFRTVMKPFAETVQRETDNAVVFDLFPNGALGRNPGQQPQMVIDGVADVAWVVQSYSPGRFPDTEVLELPGMFKDLRESSLVATRLNQHKALNDYGDFYVIGMWGTAPYSIHTRKQSNRRTAASRSSLPEAPRPADRPNQSRSIQSPAPRRTESTARFQMEPRPQWFQLRDIRWPAARECNRRSRPAG